MVDGCLWMNICKVMKEFFAHFLVNFLDFCRILGNFDPGKKS